MEIRISSFFWWEEGVIVEVEPDDSNDNGADPPIELKIDNADEIKQRAWLEPI